MVANKGVGKSSIVYYLEIQSKESGLPVVIITPTDIANDDLASTTNFALFRKKIYNSLLLSISSKLIENFGKLISEDQQIILADAIARGTEKPDFISKLSKWLAPIGEKASGIKFDKLLPTNAANKSQLLESIKRNIESSETIFYICIDDTDQFANESDPSYLQKIWYAILAASDVGKNFPNIRCIVTLRREIWERILNDNAHERDQIDHLRDMVIDFQSTEEYVKTILNVRLNKAFDEEQPKHGDSYSTFFDGKSVTLPTSIQSRKWEDFLVKNSRMRPRDTVQLMSALIRSAESRFSDKIQQIDVDAINLKYSTERKNDLVSENEVICPSLEEIIRRFKNCDFELSGNDLLKFLSNQSGIGFSIKIYARTLDLRREEDAIHLWDYLRKIGFIFPRVLDPREEQGYRHILSHEDEKMVCILRKSEILNMAWDVHPVFRSYLVSLKKEDENRRLARQRDDAKDVKGVKIKSQAKGKKQRSKKRRK